MIEKSTAPMRLCPHCANSIEEDATQCRYCKTDLGSDHDAPEWLNRDQSSWAPRVGPERKKLFSISSKFIWPAAMLVVALAAFFAGAYTQRSESSLAAQASLKQLQAKDQAFKTQEAELAQTRQQLNENSNKLTELKTKLDESGKELSIAQQRLTVTSRETNRLSANRSVAVRRTATRAPDTAAPLPPPAAPAASPRQTVESGVYETIQPTSVYENPSSSGRVVTQIGRGIRINVVRSAGDWLEVRSKHGNPPGYVRSDDARLIARAN